MKYATLKPLHTSRFFPFSTYRNEKKQEKHIDMSVYLPSRNMTKHYEYIQKHTDMDVERYMLKETISVKKIDGYTVIDTEQKKESYNGTFIHKRVMKDLVHDKRIISGIMGDTVRERYVHVGHSMLNESAERFPLSQVLYDGLKPIRFDYVQREILTDVSFADVQYKGEILKTNYIFTSDPFIENGMDSQYYYSTCMYHKKDIGLIAIKSALYKVVPTVLETLDLAHFSHNKIYFEFQFLNPKES